MEAERLIAATKANQKITVEIKSFIGAADIHQLQVAIGQFNLYRDILSEKEPERYLDMIGNKFGFSMTTQNRALPLPC